ncbi:MAG: sulfite oxidase-like oxidoreductase [Sphingomonadales bacterium]
MADDRDLRPKSETASEAGVIREKLVRAKERWAREGRLLTGKSALKGRDRLPPGQRRVVDWPVLDLGIQPTISQQDWLLTIDGCVDNPVAWNWRQFLDQPQVQLTSDIHCVTQWSRYDNDWAGVSSRHVLSVVGPRSNARHVVFHSHDGYQTNVALEVFAAPDVLLAHSWQGKPLPKEHGGPVRVVIPQYYFWKSAKWIKRIEFLVRGRAGFWERRGYHNVGDPWSEQRYG